MTYIIVIFYHSTYLIFHFDTFYSSKLCILYRKITKRWSKVGWYLKKMLWKKKSQISSFFAKTKNTTQLWHLIVMGGIVSLQSTNPRSIIAYVLCVRRLGLVVFNFHVWDFIQIVMLVTNVLRKITKSARHHNRWQEIIVGKVHVRN